MRSKVEHPFLILERDFGFAKTRYRGMVKNLNRLHISFAPANLLMRAQPTLFSPQPATPPQPPRKTANP